MTFDLTILKSRILIMRNEIKSDHQFITEYGSDVSSEEIIIKNCQKLLILLSDGVRSSLDKITWLILKSEILMQFLIKLLKSFSLVVLLQRKNIIFLSPGN